VPEFDSGRILAVSEAGLAMAASGSRLHLPSARGAFEAGMCALYDSAVADEAGPGSSPAWSGPGQTTAGDLVGKRWQGRRNVEMVNPACRYQLGVLRILNR
jgi:hypothetical protein